MHYSQKKKKKKKAPKGAEWTTNCTNIVKKLSLEVSRVDIVQFSIRLAISYIVVICHPLCIANFLLSIVK